MFVHDFYERFAHNAVEVPIIARAAFVRIHSHSFAKFIRRYSECANKAESRFRTRRTREKHAVNGVFGSENYRYAPAETVCDNVGFFYPERGKQPRRDSRVVVYGKRAVRQVRPAEAREIECNYRLIEPRQLVVNPPHYVDATPPTVHQNDGRAFAVASLVIDSHTLDVSKHFYSLRHFRYAKTRHFVTELPPKRRVTSDIVLLNYKNSVRSVRFRTVFTVRAVQIRSISLIITSAASEP